MTGNLNCNTLILKTWRIPGGGSEGVPVMTCRARQRWPVPDVQGRPERSIVAVQTPDEYRSRCRPRDRRYGHRGGGQIGGEAGEAMDVAPGWDHLPQAVLSGAASCICGGGFDTGHYGRVPPAAQRYPSRVRTTAVRRFPKSLFSPGDRPGTAPSGADRDTEIHECARSVWIGDYTGAVHRAEKQKPRLRRGFLWWRCPDLNRGPNDYESFALTS